MDKIPTSEQQIGEFLDHWATTGNIPTEGEIKVIHEVFLNMKEIEVRFVIK